MLFHSSKKSTELTVYDVNKIRETRKKVLKHPKCDKKEFCTTLYGAWECLKTALAETKDRHASGERVESASKGDALDQGGHSVYVIDFVGDMKASDVTSLREEISAIISVASAHDEVVVRLESGGGQVHSYGLAAAQLERIKAAGIPLTVCVDKIAASGGYMMACVADRIICAPFAVIGSIGVVSQMPNFYKWLKAHNIDIELFTAGEYKRTVTILGENDDEDRAKYQAELERIHELFKAHVVKYRPQPDIEKVSTGEFWFGQDALALGLVDELGTSDSYLIDKLDDA